MYRPSSSSSSSGYSGYSSSDYYSSSPSSSSSSSSSSGYSGYSSSDYYSSSPSSSSSSSSSSSRSSSSSSSSSLTPYSPPPNQITVKIGNTYTLLPRNEWVLSRDGKPKPHKWTLFLDVVSGDSSRIREVHFKLHPTFRPDTYIKEVPPYKTTQTSYGHFTAKIIIHLYRAPSVTFKHEIIFDEHAEFKTKTRVFLAGAMPTLDDCPIPLRRFGVELELTLPPYRASANSIMSLEDIAQEVCNHGIDCRSVGYTHAITEYWKLVSDSSISCSRGDEGCLTFELVSPILRGIKGMEEFSIVTSVMNSLGVRVNKSAAFHVHIDATHLSMEELRKICCQYVKYEEAFDLMVPRSRGGDNNRFAKSNRAAQQIVSDRELFRKIQTRNNPSGLNAMLCPDGRYYKLNLQRLSKESPTLEFRQHSGTSNFEKMQAWILLCLWFVDRSTSIPMPDNFHQTRSPGYKLDRLFLWVVKQPILHEHFLKRAVELLPDEGALDLDLARIFTCSCGANFKRCNDYLQHRNATGHAPRYLPESHGSCCGSCASGRTCDSHQ